MQRDNVIISIKVNRKQGTIVGENEEIIKIAKGNNGTVTTARVVKVGFSCGYIKYLADKGMNEQFFRGAIFCQKFGMMRFLIYGID